MNLIELLELVPAYTAGILTGAALAPRIQRWAFAMRLHPRCTWCSGKMPRGETRHVCAACIKAAEIDRAAPADWPAA